MWTQAEARAREAQTLLTEVDELVSAIDRDDVDHERVRQALARASWENSRAHARLMGAMENWRSRRGGSPGASLPKADVDREADREAREAELRERAARESAERQRLKRWAALPPLQKLAEVIADIGDHKSATLMRLLAALIADPAAAASLAAPADWNPGQAASVTNLLAELAAIRAKEKAPAPAREPGRGTSVAGWGPPR